MQGLDALMSTGEGNEAAGSPNWETPQEFVDRLAELFGPFALDAAATAKNAKAPRYWSSRDDGLKQSWDTAADGDERGAVFCNPPYGRRSTGLWVAKAEYEARINGNVVVLLLPARTDTRWFHDLVVDKAAMIIFVRGRIQFHVPGHERNSATFPSIVVVYDSKGLAMTRGTVYATIRGRADVQLPAERKAQERRAARLEKKYAAAKGL